MSRPRKPNIYARLAALESRNGKQSYMELRREITFRECAAHLVLRIMRKSEDVKELAGLLGCSLSEASESMWRQRKIEALTPPLRKPSDPDEVLYSVRDFLENHLHKADLNLEY